MILGAFNPSLAYAAYTTNSDVASLLPCDVVIREIASDKVSVEFIKPANMMMVLDDTNLTALAAEADEKIEKALSNA